MDWYPLSPPTAFQAWCGRLLCWKLHVCCLYILFCFTRWIRIVAVRWYQPSFVSMLVLRILVWRMLASLISLVLLFILLSVCVNNLLDIAYCLLAQEMLLKYFGRQGKAGSVEICLCLVQSQLSVYKATHQLSQPVGDHKATDNSQGNVITLFNTNRLHSCISIVINDICMKFAV